MPYVPWHAELTVSLITLLVAGAAALVMPRLGAAGIVLLAAALAGGHHLAVQAAA